MKIIMDELDNVLPAPKRVAKLSFDDGTENFGGLDVSKPASEPAVVDAGYIAKDFHTNGGHG